MKRTITLEQIQEEAREVTGRQIYLRPRDLEMTLEALRYVVTNGNWTFGLCSAMGSAPGVNPNIAATVSKGLFELWPKFSGDVTYPVPSPEDPDDEEAAFVAYQRAFHPDHPVGNNKGWDREDPYGKLRWELIEFMIEALEGALEDDS